MKIVVLAAMIALAGCSASNIALKKDYKKLQKGKVVDDTSFVYSLPFEERTAHRIVQGYYGIFSHQERASLDFLMKKGTKVCAARDGIVVRVKEDGSKGGWSRKYAKDGNHIVIQHADGSRSGYWHLQKDGALVNIGDTVKQGQVIGLSGKTGYAAAPHLHFLVWTSKNGRWQTVPTRFYIGQKPKYLKAWKKYKRTQSK